MPGNPLDFQQSLKFKLFDALRTNDSDEGYAALAMALLEPTIPLRPVVRRKVTRLLRAPCAGDLEIGLADSVVANVEFRSLQMFAYQASIERPSWNDCSSVDFAAFSEAYRRARLKPLDAAIRLHFHGAEALVIESLMPEPAPSLPNEHIVQALAVTRPHPPGRQQGSRAVQSCARILRSTQGRRPRQPLTRRSRDGVST
jgi:hypothetical protein